MYTLRDATYGSRRHQGGGTPGRRDTREEGHQGGRTPERRDTGEDGHQVFLHFREIFLHLFEMFLK